jgi:hypothetical protein
VKFLIGYPRGKRVLRDGWLPSNHFGVPKWALELPISNRMSLFQSFFDNPFISKCLVEEYIIKTE